MVRNGGFRAMNVHRDGRRGARGRRGVEEEDRRERASGIKDERDKVGRARLDERTGFGRASNMNAMSCRVIM
jgi:hypothetical protein